MGFTPLEMLFNIVSSVLPITDIFICFILQLFKMWYKWKNKYIYIFNIIYIYKSINKDWLLNMFHAIGHGLQKRLWKYKYIYIFVQVFCDVRGGLWHQKWFVMSQEDSGVTGSLWHHRNFVTSQLFHYVTCFMTSHGICYVTGVLWHHN